MTEHIADNHEALLDYLYEEGDPAARLAVGRHLQECASCSVAVLEFQNARGMLRDWMPPAAELGFRIVQEKDRQIVPVPAHAGWSARFRASGYGGWARAAAAVLLFGAGMAVSQLTMSYNDGALTVRLLPSGNPPLGESQNARKSWIELAPAANPAPVPQVAGQAAENRQAVVASDQSTEQLLQRVRAMIDQSEQRQQRELARRLLEVATEVDTQHQADLLKIQQNIGQQQDEMMNYLVRTSGGAR